MPLYDYVCPACGVEEEVNVHYKERDSIKCYKCGEPMVRRVNAVAGFVIRGHAARNGYHIPKLPEDQ